MPKIKIITDSTSYAAKEYVESNNISIVPLSYTFDGVTQKEGFPGKFEEFFKKLSSTDLFLTTSQPAVGDFLAEFQRAFDEGYDEIIAILLSSKLSGAYNSGILAKNMLEDERITIIDSLQAVSNLRFLVEDALNMANKGNTREEIVNHIENKKHNMGVYLTVESLEYLRRSGRMTGLQSVIGTVLNIKPIIELKDGKLKLFKKVRGKNKAIKDMINMIPKDTKKISICHILSEDEGIKIKESLKDKFPKAKITVDEIGPVIGGHLGTKGIGICFY